MGPSSRDNLSLPPVPPIHNLQDEVKAELVLKGATRLALLLWDDTGTEARRNCSLAVCNLAVGQVTRKSFHYFGQHISRPNQYALKFDDRSFFSRYLLLRKVNTAKMVQHGAGQLLVKLVSTAHPDMDADVRKRASAAFRNLLCVSVKK